MSHDRGWRAACPATIWIPGFHFEVGEGARGVTAMVVGSGALLGRKGRGRKGPGLKSMIRVNRLDASSLRWGCNLESRLSFETETLLGIRSRRRSFSDRNTRASACRQEFWIVLIAIASHAQRYR